MNREQEEKLKLLAGELALDLKTGDRLDRSMKYVRLSI